MAFVGHGVAGADALSDVTGKYYGQAKGVLSKAGLSPVVATRVGDLANDDKCVIDRIQPANFTNGTGAGVSSVPTSSSDPGLRETRNPESTGIAPVRDATARCAVLFESGLLGAEAPAPAGRVPCPGYAR